MGNLAHSYITASTPVTPTAHKKESLRAAVGWAHTEGTQLMHGVELVMDQKPQVVWLEVAGGVANGGSVVAPVIPTDVKI